MPLPMKSPIAEALPMSPSLVRMECPKDIWEALHHVSYLHEYIAESYRSQTEEAEKEVARLRTEIGLCNKPTPSIIRRLPENIPSAIARKPTLKCTEVASPRQNRQVSVGSDDNDEIPGEFGDLRPELTGQDDPSTPKTSSALQSSMRSASSRASGKANKERKVSVVTAMPLRLSMLDDFETGTRDAPTRVSSTAVFAFSGSQDGRPGTFRGDDSASHVPSTNPSGSRGTLESTISANASVHQLWAPVFQTDHQQWIRMTSSFKDADAVGGSDSIHSYERLTSSRYMLRPGSHLRIFWDLIGMCALLYDTIMVPLQLCDLPALDWINIIDCCVNAYWTLDMPATCCTGRYVDDDLIMDRCRVLKVYAYSWFPVDVVLVSLGWLNIIGQTYNLSLIRWIRATRFLRLLRLMKAHPWLRDGSDGSNLGVHTLLALRLVSYAVAFLIVVHMLSCSWYAIGNLRADGWVQWYVQDLSLSERYIWSVHWAMACFHANMDVQPKNTLERAFTFVVIFFAMFLVIFFTANMTNLLVQLQVHTKSVNKQNLELRTYLRERRVGGDLAIILQRRAMKRDRQHTSLEEEITVLKTLPNNLINELRARVRYPVLIKLHFFEVLGSDLPRTMFHICHASVSEVRFDQGEVLFRVRDACSQTLFVDKGSLEYSKPNKSEAPITIGTGSGSHVSSGIYVSEAALWVQTWLNQGDLVGLSPGLIYAINLDNFVRVLLQHPVAHAHISEYAQCFVLAVNTALPHDLSDLKLEEEEGIDFRRNRRASGKRASVMTTTGSVSSLSSVRSHASAIIRRGSAAIRRGVSFRVSKQSVDAMFRRSAEG